MDAGLRPYKPEDFETLYHLDQQCYPPEIAYSRRMMRWYLRLPGADCVVAERNGGVIGFILAARENELGHVITLDVAESHRRRGVATALLAAAEARMAEAGVRGVWLETATNNPAAVAFWQKHGYRTETVLKNYYAEKLDAYAMCKLLASAQRQEESKP